MKDYNHLILKRIDKSFNSIIGVTGGIAFLAAIILYFADLPVIFAVLNFTASIMLLIVFSQVNRVSTVFKILFVIGAIGVISIASFLGGGFTSAFLTLLILANLIAILFLKKRYSIGISVLTIILMFAMAYYSIYMTSNPVIGEPKYAWGLHIISMVLLLLTVHISVYIIKTYLIENIEDLEVAVIQSNKLAYYDQLTGLPNNNKFMKTIREASIEDKKDGFIILINLKSLRVINSTMGQEVGDQTLKDIANLFKEKCISNTVIARISGNEFALWNDQIRENTLVNEFNHVLESFKEQSATLNRRIEIYASYANYSYEDQSVEACYQNAILTLAYAKENKITKLVAYDSALEASFKRKLLIRESIPKAMELEEFEFYYQEKFDTLNNKVVGVEALARWEHQQLGRVGPSEFIPVIQQMNLADAFGTYALRHVCKDLDKLRRKYYDKVQVSVNISPTHMYNPQIVELVKGLLVEYNIPKGQLVLEITEDILIKGIEEVIPILKALRKLGVRISLDDFGSGYSSLNYITQMPLNEIKIDKSFIDQIEDNSRILILLENIIRLCKQFNLKIVAEGVENEEQLILLSNLGCYIIQGYYFAKPKPLEKET